MSLNDDKNQVAKNCIAKQGYIDEGTALYLDTDWDSPECDARQAYRRQILLRQGMSKEVMKKFGLWDEDIDGELTTNL